MTMYTKSQIWGTAKHPLDHEKTPGGSSGGDAGLIAAGCSPFALGSDFAGSIRIPSFFCGLTGFMPTSDRHSINGLSCYTKVDSIHCKVFKPAIGPMGRCVDDILDAMQSLSTSKIRDYDKSVPDLPFNHALYEKTLNQEKLKIGVIKNIDEICNLEREALNAFEDAKEVFEKAGHEIVEIEIKELHKLSLACLDILFNEGMPLAYEEMLKSGDALEPNTQVLFFMYNILPKFIMTIMSKIARPFAPRHVTDTLSILSPKNVDEIALLMKFRFEKLQEFSDLFYSNNLDSLLVPGYPKPAFKMEEVRDNDIPPLHLMIFNMMHFPVGAGKIDYIFTCFDP